MAGSVSGRAHVRAFHALMDRLKAVEKRWWKDILGEAHVQYDEAVIWVRLHDDSIVEDVHERLLAMLAPAEEAIRPLRFDVTYEVVIDGRPHQRACFQNGAFMKTRADPPGPGDGTEPEKRRLQER